VDASRHLELVEVIDLLRQAQAVALGRLDADVMGLDQRPAERAGDRGRAQPDDSERERRRIGYVSEDQVLPPGSSVAEIIALHRYLFPSWDTQMERELLDGNKAIRLSEVRQALENAMLRNPSHWRSYYHGDEAQQRFSRAYSYSDRCRYYWHEAEVKEEIGRLLDNLENQPLPATLISQFLPLEYEGALAGSHSTRPRDLVRAHIQAILRRYAKACGLGN